MNRQEFMKELEVLLAGTSETEKKEALQYYNDYLDDAGVEKEQDALEALGSPEQVAASIKMSLGEEEEKNSREPVDSQEANNACGNPNPGGQNSHENASHESAPHGSTPQGNPTYGNAPYGNVSQGSTPQGNPTYGNAPYGNAPQGSAPQGNPTYGNPSYGNASRGNAPYGNPPYGTPPYGNASYGNPPYGQCAAPQRKRSGGEIFLLILLGILLLPVLVPLGFGALVVLLALLVSLAVFLGALVITGLAVLAVGVILIGLAVAKLFIAPLAAIYLLGGGMVCAGLGLAMTALMLWLLIKTVPVACRGFVNLCRWPFRKRAA